MGGTAVSGTLLLIHESYWVEGKEIGWREAEEQDFSAPFLGFTAAETEPMAEPASVAIIRSGSR